MSVLLKDWFWTSITNELHHETSVDTAARR